MTTPAGDNSQPIKFIEVLRREAADEPAPVHTGPVTKETQIIAIYGRAVSARALRWPT